MPLRAIRRLVDAALVDLSPVLATLYARVGRPSVPPEQLLRAMPLQAFYSIRSERQLLSSEHFSVDGTLIQAWASTKSFRAKDGGDEPPSSGRNDGRDFRGERRSNATHASTTDPDARSTAKAQAWRPSSAFSAISRWRTVAASSSTPS